MSYLLYIVKQMILQLFAIISAAGCLKCQLSGPILYAVIINNVKCHYNCPLLFTLMLLLFITLHPHIIKYIFFFSQTLTISLLNNFCKNKLFFKFPFAFILFHIIFVIYVIFCIILK